MATCFLLLLLLLHRPFARFGIRNPIYCRRSRLFGGLVDVQIPVQLPDVLPNLTIVGQRTVAQSVGETKTVIGLNNGSSRSLQSLVFPIEFVDQHQLLGRLHQFCIGRLTGTGGSSVASFRFPLDDVFHEKITQDRQNRS